MGKRAGVDWPASGREMMAVWSGRQCRDGVEGREERISKVDRD